MEPCDTQWREKLADYALGLPASAALMEHLANCPACSATLQDWKARMGKVDAGIRQLAASEPPAQAASRAMARVRARGERAWLPGWGWGTAVVCGLVLVFAIFLDGWKVHEHHQEAEKALSAASAIGHWRSPTDSLLSSSSDRWLKVPPRFGKYFYPLNANVSRKESEHL